MKAADIKEFIQNSKVKIESMLPPNAKKKADEALREVLSMLDELEDKTDNTTEWIKLTTHGMIRFQCKKCDSIFSLPWEHCPKCGRKVTNNIKTNVHKYNYETGKLEELK